MLSIKRIFQLRFWRQQGGTIAMMFAALLPVIIGGLAMGTDIATWYLSRRSLQSAVDAAAVATAYDISGNSTQATLQQTASSEMARNGYGNGSNITLTLNYPPASGAYSGDSGAVEVIVSQPQPLAFMGYFLTTQATVGARAVADRPPSGQACILALNGTVNAALSLSGSASINLLCSAAANSTSQDAISLSGHADLTAQDIYTPGNYSTSGSSTLSTSSPPVTGSAPLADPYAGVNVPGIGACTYNNFAVNGGSQTLNPGVYCNGLNINGNANVTLSAGTYIIDRGSFNVNGGATLSGNGVTIILTSSTGSNYATANINGGATVTLSAPTTGTYAGLAFFQDRNAPSNGSDSFNGGSTMNITGAMYFPDQSLNFTGGNTTGSGSCTEIIASTITFTGNSNINSNCPNSGIQFAGPAGSVKLVE